MMNSTMFFGWVLGVMLDFWFAAKRFIFLSLKKSFVFPLGDDDFGFWPRRSCFRITGSVLLALFYLTKKVIRTSLFE